MKTLTAFVTLSLIAAASMMTSARRSLRFTELSDLLLNQDELYKKVSLCPHSPKTETDSRGHSWPRFCFVSRDGEELEVLFQREYRGEDWTYRLDQYLGLPEFQFRVLERIRPCASGESETDGQGVSWSLWCHGDGSPVHFQRTSSDADWTYVVDSTGGLRQCEFRRVEREKTSFEETEWTFFWDVFGLSDRDDVDEAMVDDSEAVCEDTETPEEDISEEQEASETESQEVITDTAEVPISAEEVSEVTSTQESAIQEPIAQEPVAQEPAGQESTEPLTQDCYPMETDNSGRYFWVQFDSEGQKVAFQRDARGNFLLSNDTQTRIPEVSGLQLEPISDRDIALACDLIDTETNAPIELQPDASLSGVFWVVDGKSYENAETEEELAYGMYRLDDETGARVEVAGL